MTDEKNESLLQDEYDAEKVNMKYFSVGEERLRDNIVTIDVGVNCGRRPNASRRNQKMK